MKRALVWFCGLNTSIDSDWCGIRGSLEALAKLGNMDLVAATWDGEGMAYPVNSTFKRLAEYEFVAAGGHSHGAWKLYTLLEKCKRGSFDVAAFLDLAPYANPLAWAGGAWPVPSAVKRALCFYQRLDAPLAGVKLSTLVGGDAELQSLDVSTWGLGHSEMVGDERVKNRIAAAVLRAVNDRLHQDFMKRTA